jgi:hypothetical protein
MQRKIITIGLMSMIAILTQAQIRVLNNPDNIPMTNSPAFVDASSNRTVNLSANLGKGLVFPRVDLSTFTLLGTGYGANTNFPTYLDGMIVYNTASEGSAGVGSTEGTLTPGYWYYENKSGTTTGGTWKPLGSGDNAEPVHAGNGLTENEGEILLGGSLTKNTEINTATYNLYTTGTGKVGIGTAPENASAKFEVDGAAANKEAYNAGSATSIDFCKSNLAYTTANAGVFTLSNLKDGGAYTLAVRGTTSGTSSFTATNTAGSDVTVKIVNSMATTDGKETLYTILVMGSTAYVFVNTGF